MNLCHEGCKHGNQYNCDWCICYHKKIKGSKVKFGTACPVALLKEQAKKSAKEESNETSSGI